MTGSTPRRPLSRMRPAWIRCARSKLAKVPAQERDKKVEAVGLERWKQANAKVKPEIVRGEQFIMFSNLPSDRASKHAQGHGKQPGHLKKLHRLARQRIGSKKSASLSSPIGRDFIEFVRSVEKSEIEADTSCRRASWRSVNLIWPSSIQRGARRRTRRPASGRGAVQTRRGKGRGKHGGDRSLAGILTEALGKATVASAGNPPRWLAMGSALTWLRRSSRNRATITSNCGKPPSPISIRAGGPGQTMRWAESDQITADGVHAVGFALVEAMMSGMRQGFPAFVNGMVQGGDKLDEILQNGLRRHPREFLDGTGDWVAAHYGGLAMNVPVPEENQRATAGPAIPTSSRRDQGRGT